MYIDIDGCKIRYDEYGKGNKKHLLFIHGLGSSSVVWSDVPEILSDDFHSISVDLIGFGESDKPKLNYTIPFFTQFIKNFLRHLGVSDQEKMSIVGHELGGHIALEYSIENKEQVENLVLIDSFGMHVKLNPLMKQYLEAVKETDPILRYNKVKKVLEDLLEYPSRLLPLNVDIFIAILDKPGAVHAFESALRNSTANSIDIERLKQIENIPCLIVWGDKDKLVPIDYGYSLHKLIPKSQMIKITGAGHNPLRERPFPSGSKIIDFLKDKRNREVINIKKVSNKKYNLKDFFEKSHAIIIGISKYKEENGLVNAHNDAVSIKKVLEEKYDFDNIITLYNEHATGEKMREIFVDVLQDENKISPKDRVIVYYSGHGKLRTILGRAGEEIKEGYIVPYDSRKEKYSSNIAMRTVIEACQNCPAKHVLLILDCCYSGFAATRSVQIRKPHVATEDYIKDISSRAAVQILAAGQEDQPVSDSGIRPGYSAFTGALLDILEPEMDPDDNGILTVSEIGFNLESKVAIHEQRGPYQRPLYSHISGSQGGDFIFKIFNVK